MLIHNVIILRYFNPEIIFKMYGPDTNIFFDYT